MRRKSVEPPPDPFRVRATAALFLPLTLAFLVGCAARPMAPRQEANDASLLRAADAVRLWRPSLEESAIASDEVVIHFDSGKDGLSPTAAKKLDLAAQLFHDAAPAEMLVTGYADSRGKEWPNLLLSAQRAAIVKQALVRRGVPPDRLALRAFGIADFHDGDAPAGSENRVVVLTWRLM